MHEDHRPEPVSSATPTCYRHPGTPTRLACSECGRFICTDCSRDAAVGQKCPECAKPIGRNRVIDARRTIGIQPRWQDTPFTYGMIGVAAAIFLLETAGVGPNFFSTLSQWNVAVGNGEWWRILTAALLHGGFLHLAFNMYALYILGPRLEREVGSVPFAGLYLASAAVGGAVFYIVGSPGAVAVGASGAIFGLFGAWTFVSWKLRHTPAGRAQFNQFLALLAINAALPLLIPNIAWEAHVGGFAAGVAIAFLWGQFAARRPNAVAIRTVIAAFVLALAIVTVLVI